MSLTIPLAVVLETDLTTRRVTRQVRDLTIRSTAPGGFASASIALDRPLSLQPDEIAYYGKLLVHDARSGAVVWEGRLEDPGRSAGADGQIWDLAAVGPAAHASDRTLPLVYVDRQLDSWHRSDQTHGQARVELEDVPSVPDGATWRLTANEGSASAIGDQAKLINTLANAAGMEIARLAAANVHNGATTSNLENRLETRATPGGSATTVDSNTWSTTNAPLAASRGGSPSISSGQTIAHVGWTRTGNPGTNGANVWGSYRTLVLRTLLKDKSGADITSGYSANTVLASEVVADLLGRLLPQYDGANASIATTSYAIEQLAYPDGVTPGQVLDDLMQIEPAYYWAAWEANSAELHRFEWTAWPTAVRYEASVVDGYSSTGSADGLFNAVSVRFRAALGRARFRTRTSTVPELDNAGLTRTAYIDLSDEASATEGQADQVGDQFLADHATPPNAGALTIARPIRDTILGRYVMPWEIRPGALIRARGILPRVDALNATARDGVTVFRIAASTFRASDASAQLELDSYAPSTARAIADLQRRRRRRR